MECPGKQSGSSLGAFAPCSRLHFRVPLQSEGNSLCPEPLPGRGKSFIRHGHSSMHQLPDAGSLEPGTLAVDHFGALDRILSLEGLAAGTPGLADRRDAEVRSPVCLHWCSCAGSLGILDRTRSSLFAKLMSDRRGRFGRYGQHFLPALASRFRKCLSGRDRTDVPVCIGCRAPVAAPLLRCPCVSLRVSCVPNAAPWPVRS